MEDRVRRSDLHRHFGGSISCDTIWALLQKHGLYHVASTLDQVVHRMTFKNTIARDFKVFLDKFVILDEVRWDEYAIELAISQVVKEVADDNLSDAIFSITLDKYLRSGWELSDIVRLISDLTQYHARLNNVRIGYLFAIRYDSPRDHQERLSKQIIESSLHEHFVGIDFVGSETAFDPIIHGKIMVPWSQMNKVVRVHVGELPHTCDNVTHALTLPINRIAHGIYGKRDDWIKAARLGIPFDLAVHSNLYTGAVKFIHDHPIREMLSVGARITLNTDDPVQFGIRYDDEFNIMEREGILLVDELLKIKANAIEDTDHIHNCQNY